jgi:hypothetical protein
MDKKISTPLALTKRQKFWLEHFRSCEAAGNSYKSYAKRHDLKINTFHVNIRRLRLLGIAVEQSDEGYNIFKKIPVQPIPTESISPEVRLCFPNGISIEFNSHFDKTTLPTLLQTVAQIK